jgi:hypothetical protein
MVMNIFLLPEIVGGSLTVGMIYVIWNLVSTCKQSWRIEIDLLATRQKSDRHFCMDNRLSSPKLLSSDGINSLYPIWKMLPWTQNIKSDSIRFILI